MARKHSAQHQDNRAANGASPGPSGPSGLTPRQGKAPGHTLPESARGNAWTRGKMARFLDALAQSASVSAAAASVGMSRQSAYRLRARLSGQPFDYAWEAALEFGLQQLAHAALDRALNGVEEPVFHAGEQIGTRTRYDERLTMFLLANPARIGRHPFRREAMLHHWEELLDHVEHGPVDWEGTAQAVEAAENDPAAAGETAVEQARIDRRLDDFLAWHSHYAARAREEARRAAPSRSPLSPPPPPGQRAPETGRR
jgi:hypothetical protein